MNNENWGPVTFLTPKERHNIIEFLYLFIFFILFVGVAGIAETAHDKKEMNEWREERLKQEQIQFASNKFQARLKKERWERNHNAPEREIFRKRSENFVDKVDENALDIVVEVPAQQLKKAHVGITNYLSNVGGKIDKTEDATKFTHGTKLYYVNYPPLKTIGLLSGGFKSPKID